jgi:hypothetical protein
VVLQLKARLGFCLLTKAGRPHLPDLMISSWSLKNTSLSPKDFIIYLAFKTIYINLKEPEERT